MKLALAQLNYKIGDFVANKKKIIENIEHAKTNNVDLVIFSELAICGYPPLDFLGREEFIAKCVETLHDISKYCTNIAAIVGSPSINPETKGKQLYNSAWFLSEGKAEPVAHKTLLPTYDIFDEYRHFEPNHKFGILNYKGKKIAIAICEDLWDNQPVEASFSRNKLYKQSPISELSKFEPDFLINIAASPFSYHQHFIRRRVITEKAREYNLPIFYINQVGGNTELLFDGGSMAVTSDGNVAYRMKYFEEDFFVTNYDLSDYNSSAMANEDEMKLIYKALVVGLRDYFQKSGFTNAVLGLSGGIDSALTAAIAVEALGNKFVHGILMPSQYSSQHSIDDAIELANNLKMSYSIAPISNIYDTFEQSLSPIFAKKSADVTEENIQARIRGVLLMAYSNKFGNILLNTSNKSEMAVGYGTLYGDMCGGLSILGDVYKTQVYKLAHLVNEDKVIIPINTIQKPPSAELRPDQKDSDSLPDYATLDGILFRYIEMNNSIESIIAEGFDKDTTMRTISMLNKNEYKRIQCPPILRVSGKAFGIGRKMPVVAKY